MLDVLKTKLSEELYNQVSEALKGESLEKYVPKARLDEELEKRKEAQTKLESYADYEEIKKERDEIKGKIETYANYEELKAKAEKLDSYEGLDEKLTKFETLVADNKRLKLKSMGFDETFVDYALTKIDGEKDFDTAAKTFLEENPKLKAENFQKIDSQLGIGGTPKKIEEMETEEYVKWRETHDLDGTEKK